MELNHIVAAKKEFLYYKQLAEKTFAQLPDEALFWQYNPESNSIASIVKHMSGNMLSRWTDFLTTDGEKEWRNREAEFDNDLKTREQMLQVWENGWKCLFNALDSINENNADRIVYIRNQGHTITEAIYRQLAHYPHHVGQIVYIGKMVLNDQWKSLSIPRGESQKFNDEKFSKPKEKKHFTEE